MDSKCQNRAVQRLKGELWEGFTTRGVLNSCIITGLFGTVLPGDQLSLFGVAHPFCHALLGRSCLQPSSCACQCCSSALFPEKYILAFFGQTTCVSGVPSGLSTSKLSCSFPAVMSVCISQGCNACKGLCCCVVTIIENPLKSNYPFLVEVLNSVH